MDFLREKSSVCAACLKNSVHIFVENIYKMGCLKGSGVPALHIGPVAYPEFFGGGGFKKFS
jgi:hypothetical protein